MTLRIGLMGFGRIGRNIFRIGLGRNDLEFGAISDIADPLALTYLATYDSLYGRLGEPLRLVDGKLRARAQEIPFLNGRHPGEVPWGDLGVDTVIEATGRYRSFDELSKHLDAGAKRVIVCVPPTTPLDLTLVRGVNDEALKPSHRVLSVGSCTANATAPVLKVLHEAFGVDKVFLNSVHAYSNDQRVADVPHSDLRRSRAAAENIIPTDSRSGAAIAAAYPPLEGRISSSALNVPVPDGSLADMTLQLSRPASVGAINAALYRATLGPLRGILGYTADPVVSRDMVQTSESGVVDSLATMSMEGGMAKVLVWFENGWGYAHRVLEVCERLQAFDLEVA